MTHTPGPWTWDSEFADGDEFREERLDKRDANSGAGFTLEGPDRSVLIPWDYEGYSAGIYIREADAKLIAAAPKLLAAIETVLSTWREQGFHESRGDFDECAELLKQAIAEATS